MWHKGLLYKIEKFGICGKLLELLTSYLCNRKQYVSINGCSSSVKTLQGSVLGPLLFLIYINIYDDIICDDPSMFQQVYNGNIMYTANIVNHDLAKINKWAKKWLICINTKKTVVMLISRKKLPSVRPPITLNGSSLSVVKEHKQLGLTISHQLT